MTLNFVTLCPINPLKGTGESMIHNVDRKFEIQRMRFQTLDLVYVDEHL